MIQGPSHGVARWLAPLALVGGIVAILLVLQHSDAGSAGSTTTTTATTAARPHAHRPHRRFYVVKRGDVLSAIAVRTGVPLATILRLNPKLAPQSLQRGQRIKLR